MPRVPITIMGYRCERCEHEWIPRAQDRQPTICPKCKSPYWDRPKRGIMTYEEFRDAVQGVLSDGQPITWTELRTKAKLPQAFPNNQWVRRMERDIGLRRDKEKKGPVLWGLASKNNKGSK